MINGDGEVFCEECGEFHPWEGLTCEEADEERQRMEDEHAEQRREAMEEDNDRRNINEDDWREDR